MKDIFLVTDQQTVQVTRKLILFDLKLSFRRNIQGFKVTEQKYFNLACLLFALSLLIFLEFFFQVTLTVTLQFWSIFILTQLGCNKILIDKELTDNNHLTESMHNQRDEE